MRQAEQETYPHSPGWKRHGTSRAAAKSIKPKAMSLENKSLTVLENHGPHTADEIAAILEVSILSIRPRMSQLLTKKLIFDSGIRRLNESGKQAIVWTV